MDLTVQRRHSKKCPDREKGPNFLKCRGKRPCPLWVYGCEGREITYYSLGMRDLGRALKRLGEINAENQPPPAAKKTVSEAIQAFLSHKGNRSPETLRKYRRNLKTFESYCEERGLGSLPSITVETLDPFVQAHRKPTPGWYKTVEQLRSLFKFAVARKWCEENPALEIELPEIEEGEEIVPYTRHEVAKMISACDGVGKCSYERLRARAMVLLLRFSGMRISDVVTLSRDHIKGNYIVKRAIKNNALLRIEIPVIVMQALEALPHPKAAARESRMYFAGQGNLRSLVKGAERLLWSVFARSEVKGAYPHRFRHTFASELLAKGEPIEVVADLLGDSVNVVRKHYRKWMEEWQIRKDKATRKLSEDHKIDSTNLRQQPRMPN